MSSIGSFSTSPSYTPSFGRIEPARPTSASEQTQNAKPNTLPGSAETSPARTATPVTPGDVAGNSEREAEVRQKLTGKEAELEMVEQAEIRELSARDREVRAHEQAHMAVGGQYAGGVSYDYSRGPDGRLYAVGGSVSIDISPVSGDPAATIDKMQQVQRAALAPAEPSGQDRAVAAQAAQMIAQARAEIASRNVEGNSGPSSDTPAGKTTESDDANSTETAPVVSGMRELATYRQVNSPAISDQAVFSANA